MRDSLGDKQRLIHISEAASSIHEFLIHVTKDEFLKNYMLQLAITKLLENIGEATGRISKELQTEHSEINWLIMVRSRNVYVNQYFALDLNILWEIAVNDVPPLKKQIDKLLLTRFSYP